MFVSANKTIKLQTMFEEAFSQGSAFDWEMRNDIMNTSYLNYRQSRKTVSEEWLKQLITRTKT